MRRTPARILCCVWVHMHHTDVYGATRLNLPSERPTAIDPDVDADIEQVGAARGRGR